MENNRVATRHHFLPATFLTSFSTDVNLESRAKRVFVGFKESGKVNLIAVDEIAHQRHLYKVRSFAENPDFIEDLWSRYESDLKGALDRLIAGTIDALSWARILVPFVACMLVRGPDFNDRFERRLGSIAEDLLEKQSSEENTNFARLFELQRLLGPVAAAKWIVLTELGNETTLLTNDMGYVPFRHISNRDSGIAIPLNQNHVLLIVPQFVRSIANFENGQWMPVIEYLEDDPEGISSLNEVIAINAQRFVIGSNRNVVEKYLCHVSKFEKPKPFDIPFLPPRFERAHELTWHRIVTIFEQIFDENSEVDFHIDWELLKKGWFPPVIHAINLLEFPPALKIIERTLWVDFYNPEYYYALSSIKTLQEMKNYDAVIVECDNSLNPTMTIDQKVKILTAKAGALDELGRLDEALIIYDEALELEPTNYIANVDKGVTLLKKEMLLEAEKIFSFMIEKYPKLGPAYINRAIVFLNNGDLDKALEDNNKSIELLPKGTFKAKAYFNRGNILDKLNRHQEALDDFSESIILSPGGAEKSLFYYHRALTYLVLA